MTWVNIPQHSTSRCSMTTENQVQFKTWMCLICGWVYDEAAGLPDEGSGAGAPQQFAEGGIARQVDSKNDGVQEVADQRLSFAMPPDTHRRGDGDIVFAAVRPHEQRVDGEKCGEAR